MQAKQREQNPDVNSYKPDVEPTEDTGSGTGGTPTADVERPADKDLIPVPPDAQPAAPVEEPPGTDGPPVGDVDDSPKRIA